MKLRLQITLILLICVYKASYTQWFYQNVPQGIGIALTIDFTNLQNGAAGGWILLNVPTGRALYSTNSGLNWNFAQIPDSSRALVTLQLLNLQTGYCAGAYNTDSVSRLKREKLYTFKDISVNLRYRNFMRVNIAMDGMEFYKGLFLKTTNGGQSWNTYGTLPSNVYYLIGLHFLNLSTGYATASLQYPIGTAGILKTSDGGLTWSTLPIPNSIFQLSNIYFTDINTGFAVGWLQNPRGVILRTSNAGVNWSMQTIILVDNFTDIHFTNASTGFITGVDTNFYGVVYKTTNAGLNWFRTSMQLDGYIFYGVEFLNSTGTGIVHGKRGDSTILISKTTNYGINWNNYTFNDDALLIGSKLIDLNNWYVSGGNVLNRAIILHTTNGGAIAIKPISSEIPNKFKLHQNYPNPFNPITKIKFDLPYVETIQELPLQLIFYDVLGREVTTLFNKELKAGS
ncbi:MAG: hypothetical protein ACRDFC_05440, partial [Ignavibacteria bacterium]